MTIAAVLTGIWLLSETGSLLAPFFVSLVLAYILDPLVDRLEGRGMTRSFAVLALILPALVLLSAVATSGQGFLVKKATVNVAAERTAYAPGETARLGIWMTIEEGWHTNSHQPTFDYLIPTAMEVDPPSGWTVEGLDYPPGKLATFAFEYLFSHYTF